MPTPTNYIYSVASDTLNGKVSVADLEQQIVDSDISIALSSAGILEEGDVLTIHFKDALPDVSLLDDEVNNHDGVSYGGEDLSLPVKVLEQDEDPAKQVNGYYRGVGLTHVVPAAVGISYTDFTFPYDIAMLNMEYAAKSYNEDDYFSVCVYPETVVGALTANVAANDTVFNVSPTVLDNVQEGFAIHLSDGTNNDMCGFVIKGGIDKQAGTLSVDIGAEHAFTAVTPTYVKFSVPVVENVKITGTSTIELGGNKIGGSYVPANTAIRFHYDNKDGVAKEFHGILEILW